MKLMKIEKETLILFNEEEKTVRIQTYNSLLKRRVVTYCKKYPHKGKILKGLEQGGIISEVDKENFSIRFIPPYSLERKEQMRRVGKKTQLERR